MTEPSPARIPWLLDGIRRQAEQLLEQTKEVEAWIEARKATYDKITQHLSENVCQCGMTGPDLCDKHATIMLMVGGPMDGEMLFHRLAGTPLPVINFGLPRSPALYLVPRPDVDDLLPQRSYVSYQRVGPVLYVAGYRTQSRVWMYTC